jgi:hypothetical protein
MKSNKRFVNYKKGCTRLAAASDKVYQLFAHGRWFSPGALASSTTKTCRHDIAEILLKVALIKKKSKKKLLSYLRSFTHPAIVLSMLMLSFIIV